MPSLQSESISKLAPAWVAAQAELTHVKKGRRGQVGQNKNYRYADFAGTVDAVKPILAKHDLSFTQGFLPCPDGVIVQTTLIHTSGEWLSDGGLRVPASQQNAQQFGSAATYARRYGLNSLLGLGTEDDDGKAPAPPERAPVAAKAAEKALTQAERKELIDLAVSAGVEEDVAVNTVAGLARSRVPAFKQKCAKLIAERGGE